jgi:hypothetical protein
MTSWIALSSNEMTEPAISIMVMKNHKRGLSRAMGTYEPPASPLPVPNGRQRACPLARSANSPADTGPVAV